MMAINEDLKYYNLIRNAVHKDWDPIGVSRYSAEMGEYDGYLPKLLELLKNGGTEAEVFTYLWTMETDAMGLAGNEHATRDFAKRLLQNKPEQTRE